MSSYNNAMERKQMFNFLVFSIVYKHTLKKSMHSTLCTIVLNFTSLFSFDQYVIHMSMKMVQAILHLCWFLRL